MTKRALFLAILTSLLALGGCASRTATSQPRAPRAPSGFQLFPPLLTVVVVNNTQFLLVFEENGRPIYIGNRPAALLPGGTVSRELYNFMGRREVVVTAKAFCYAADDGPPERQEAESTATMPGPNRSAHARVMHGRPSTDCMRNQYVGTVSRSFYINSDGGQYRVDHWEINSVRGPRSSSY